MQKGPRYARAVPVGSLQLLLISMAYRNTMRTKLPLKAKIEISIICVLGLMVFALTVLLWRGNTRAIAIIPPSLYTVAMSFLHGLQTRSRMKAVQHA
jgi:hypothetical protein